MSKDLRRSREQRRLLLEAASDIIAQDPTGKISLEDIALKAGYTKGMVYYYFKSKGELLYHLYMYASDLAEDAVYPITTDKTIPPRERLERVLYAEVKVLCTHWQVWRCFWWDVGLRQLPADLARIVLRRRKEFNTAIAKLVEEVNRSEGKVNIDHQTVGRLIMDLVDSTSRWYKTGGRYSPDDVAQLVVHCVLNGFFSRVGSTEKAEREDRPVAMSPGRET